MDWLREHRELILTIKQCSVQSTDAGERRDCWKWQKILKHLGIDPFVPGSLQRALSPGTSVGSTILHLSAHGTPQGLVLEDGKGSAHLLKFELLQEMLALRESGQSPCELVVVNACHSSAVGQFLAESGFHTWFVAMTGSSTRGRSPSSKLSTRHFWWQ